LSFRKEKMEKMDKTVRFYIIWVCYFIMRSLTFLDWMKNRNFFSHRKRWSWRNKWWCRHFFSEVEAKIFITLTVIHCGICTKSWLQYDLKHWGPTRKNQTKIDKMSPQRLSKLQFHGEVRKWKFKLAVEKSNNMI